MSLEYRMALDCQPRWLPHKQVVVLRFRSVLSCTTGEYRPKSKNQYQMEVQESTDLNRRTSTRWRGRTTTCLCALGIRVYRNSDTHNELPAV